MGLFSRFADALPGGRPGYSNSDVRVATTEYVFFSLETPNRANDAVCSIGVLKTSENGTVKYRKGFLVHPEEPFDRRSIAAHGIALADVADAPTFAELWRAELGEVFEDAVLVSFDAAFNMLVLNRVLQHYGLAYPSDRYIDIRTAAVENLDGLEEPTLGEVCRRLRANPPAARSSLANAVACGEAFFALRRKTGIEDHRGKHYYWRIQDRKAVRRNPACSQAMAELYGICLGIAFDVPINEGEIACIRDWMARNAAYRRTPFFSECYALIEQVLADGILTVEEHERILDYTRPFVFDRHSAAETVDHRQLVGVLRGVASDGDISANEAAELASWLDERPALLRDPNIAHFNAIVQKARAEGALSPAALEEAMSFIAMIIDPRRRDRLGKAVVKGRLLCLTGEFASAPRREIERAIVAAGGEVASVVTPACTYVVVGERGFADRAPGDYGPKVRRAIELQQRGYPVQVIMERDLLDALE